MVISLIAVLSKDGAIGSGGGLIYDLPNDMRHFRDLTMGHTVIMGLTTFRSLPHGPLVGRRNIVLSRTVKEIEGCYVYSSLSDALGSCSDDEEVFVIGGGSVYAQSIDLADKLYLTEVDDVPLGGDVFFPDYSGFREVSREDCHKDNRHGFAYSFVEYVKCNH